MKHRSLIALALALVFVSPVRAAQNSVVAPTTGPMSLGTFVSSALNPALQSLFTCNAGTLPPANGIGNAAQANQCWWDTSASPNWVLKYYDNTQWAPLATLNITAHSFSIATSEIPSTKTGTTYSFSDADKGSLLIFSNAAAVAAALSQAGASGNFAAGWYVDVKYVGASAATITPSISTIDGLTSFPVQPKQSIRIVSDGTNYHTLKGLGFPNTASLGGVFSNTCSTSQWLNAITTLGATNCAQPNFTDLAGTASLAQLPAFSGMTSAAAAGDADTFPTNQGAGNLKQSLGAIKTWIKSWIAKADVGLGSVANVDTTNAANISSGTLAAARGGAGTVSGALKGNGSGVVSQAACADLSNAAPSCATDTTTQANVAFTGLTSGAGVTDTDTFATNQGAGNLKQTFAAVKTWVKGWIAKADVGLGSVDNTADAAKNVLSATKLTTARNIDGQSFDGSANITVIAPGTHAATSKTTPVDADEIPLVDSASSNTLAKLTWANLKATIKTYYDSLTTTLTNKTINCANNTCTVRLGSDVTGTVQATNFPPLTGEVTSPGGSLAMSVTNASVIAKLLTAFSAGAGTVSSSDSILTALQKVVGNIALKADAANSVLTGLTEIQGAVKKTGISTPSQITSNQNDYNPSSAVCASDTLVLSSDASRDITGLAGGVSGCELLLINGGSNPIVLKDSAAGSSAGNRFLTGADITLASSQAARLIYQAGSTNKWRYIGVPGSGSGGAGVSSVACAEGANCPTITSSGTVKTTFARHFQMPL